MGLLPIPAPNITQGASRAGFWRAAALYGDGGVVAGRGQPGQQRWKTSERKRGLMKTQHSASPA